MKIHQVIHHSRLQIILYPIDNDLAPHVNNLAISHIALVLVQRLIDSLVHLNPLSEILGGLFWVLALVVWRSSLDFEDVTHNEILVVTFTLHEECFNFFGVAAFFDPASSGFGAVCGIENGDEVVGLAEPVAHVCDCGFCGGFP
jgi:hypothetical protein